MELKFGATVWYVFVVSALAFSSIVSSAPLTIDFSKCGPGIYPGNLSNPLNASDVFVIQCCPLPNTKPIINGTAGPSTKTLRIRKASQCLDEAYKAKLEKGYALMRALPYSDPRNLDRQWETHCAYCGGSFFTVNSTGIVQTIDIHFSWLFFPWHRWYLYFHERILQSLLGDPTFSLNFWDWGSPYSVGDGSDSTNGACLRQGDNFPVLYNDSSGATYDTNRSQLAKGNGKFLFPDLGFNPLIPWLAQNDSKATEEQLIQSNLNLMYNAMVGGGNTTARFFGPPLRAGDPRVPPFPIPVSGILESTVHISVHSWIGQDPPSPTNDMGTLYYAARDPIFFAHHSNIDRLWEVWKALGPVLGEQRQDYTDPDFLNAEFLFYDENQDLRRVTVGDGLDTKKLGYVYQGANDAPWLNPILTRCGNLNYTELITEASSLPVPTKKKGYYHLQAGTTFTIVLDRPLNPRGLEEFLTIDGIKLNKAFTAGFDVFIDLLHPTDYAAPCRCAEFGGRFANLAQSLNSANVDKAYVWKQSITKTLVGIQAKDAPSKLVITLVPFSPSGGYETIKFTSIAVELSLT